MAVLVLNVMFLQETPCRAWKLCVMQAGSSGRKTRCLSVCSTADTTTARSPMTSSAPGLETAPAPARYTHCSACLWATTHTHFPLCLSLRLFVSTSLATIQGNVMRHLASKQHREYLGSSRQPPLWSLSAGAIYGSALCSVKNTPLNKTPIWAHNAACLSDLIFEWCRKHVMNNSVIKCKLSMYICLTCQLLKPAGSCLLSRLVHYRKDLLFVDYNPKMSYYYYKKTTH